MKSAGLYRAAIAAAALAVAPASFAYETPVHFTVTLWLAEATGFSEADAFEIAKYDQATDDDPETQPLPDWTSTGTKRREAFHFVDSKRLAQLQSDARGCDPKKIGQYLHALEDEFSHRNYGPKLGHALSGTTPDKPWTYPGQFFAMVERKFDALKTLRSKCGSSRSAQTTAPRNFSSSLDAIKAWVNEEHDAGAIPPGSPGRWNALLPKIYLDRYDAYKVQMSEYAKWVDGRKRNGWK